MAKQKWRLTIDKAIAAELDAAKLPVLHGDYRYLELSDETLAIISIWNQSSSKRSLVNARVHILDFRASCLQAQIAAFDLVYYSSVTVNIPQRIINEGTPTEQIQQTIHDIVDHLANRVLPDTRDRYSTSSSIVTELSDRQYNLEVLIPLLIVVGKIKEALELAYTYTKALESADALSSKWLAFKSNFDHWLKNGAAIPSKQAAREFFFERVKTRAEG